MPRFSYSKEYMARSDSRAISISLPIQDEPFSHERTKIFFDGLLPEGFMRKSIATNMHFDENDFLSILYYLGKECIGAIMSLGDGIKFRPGSGQCYCMNGR